MRRIIRKACVIGQEAGERRGVRLETPSGFSMVSLWYSSVLVAKNMVFFMVSLLPMWYSSVVVAKKYFYFHQEFDVTPTVAASVFGVLLIAGIGMGLWGFRKYRQLAVKYQTAVGELKALQGRIGKQTFV